MRIIYFLVILVISNSLYAQQRIVSGSYVFPFQFNLFEKDFEGRIQLVTRFSHKLNPNPEPDTMNYISDKNGLFYAWDTTKLNLDDMREGIHFDYNSNSQTYVDKAGRTVKIFDTSYLYGEDRFTERILFYPKTNFFIQRQHKNSDTSYIYMTRLFDKEKKIKRITYGFGKHPNISTDSILSYLERARFSQIYEYNYKKIKGEEKIIELNYYRYDKTNGGKLLYASNKYFYGENNMVKKTIFDQFNGVARVKGEVFYDYFPGKTKD